jgi:hypothetical protein
MNEATNQRGSDQSPESANQSGTAAYISRRPAWAARTRVDSDSIIHTWASGVEVEDIDEETGSPGPVGVEIFQVDTLHVDDEGVVLDPGEPRIFVLDSWFDIDNARKLATALHECCDRYEQAQSRTARSMSLQRGTRGKPTAQT